MPQQVQSDSFLSDIIENMRGKETSDLLKIWGDNDRDAWSDDAFVAIHDILQERLGSVPEQAQPEDRETGDIWHNPDRLFSIATWAKSLSWAALIVCGLLAIVQAALQAQSLAGTAPMNLGVVSYFFLSLVSGLISAAVLFLVLQGVGEIIYILIDIFDNSK
jgi:hypothetical protein